MINIADTELEQLAKTSRNPSQETRYQELLRATGVPLDFAGGNNTTTDQFQFAFGNAQQQDIFKKAIAPAVSSLEASRPEVKTTYESRAAQVEAGRTPLMERYQKLIDDIKGAGASQVADTTRVAAQEFGRRGIPLSSTFAQEESLRRTQPLEQATTSQVKDVSLDREERLRGLDDLITNLTQEQVAAQRDITNTIAQIQATAGTNAANAALQMYQFQQQTRQQELDRAISEKNAETARITANRPGTQIITANGRQLLIDSSTGATIRDIGPSGTGGGSGGITITGGTPVNTTTSSRPGLNTFNTPPVAKPNLSSLNLNLSSGAGGPVYNYNLPPAKPKDKVISNYLTSEQLFGK